MTLKVLVTITSVITWTCNDIKYPTVSGGLKVVKCNSWGPVCSAMEVYSTVPCGNVTLIFIGACEHL